MNTNVTAHDALVDNYLRAVGQALTGVPAYRRDELLEDLREHIAAGRAELGDDETEAEVRSLLDQLGDPAEVAAEARLDAPLATAPPLQVQPSKKVGAAVWVLIALGLCAMLCVGALLIGLFVFSRASSSVEPNPAPNPIVTETTSPFPSPFPSPSASPS
jgi:uncharacterized membrane protein